MEKKMSLTTKMLVALVLGVITGFVLQNVPVWNISEDRALRYDVVVDGVFVPEQYILGDIAEGALTEGVFVPAEYIDEYQVPGNVQGIFVPAGQIREGFIPDGYIREGVGLGVVVPGALVPADQIRDDSAVQGLFVPAESDIAIDGAFYPVGGHFMEDVVAPGGAVVEGSFVSAGYTTDATSIRDDVIIDGILRFVGELFLNGIWMVVVPLIFVSLVVGITSITDPKKVGRIGGKLALIYLLSTFPAIGAAMFFGTVLDPARGVTEESISAFYVSPTIGTPPGVIDILIGIVPRNPFAALSGGQTLQVIFIAIAVALAIISVGEAAKPVRDLFVSLNEVIMKITAVVMKFAPYGVFALLARTFSRLGIEAILALIAFVLVVWLALAFHTVVVYGTALKVFVGKDPHTGKSINLLTLFKKAAPALAFAFSSASSAATLPVTMRCGRNLGFSKEMASITFPMGVTLNMDGTAIFQGVAAVFLASFLGVNLSPGDILTILITATMATLGAAGVPGAGMIMLSMVLVSVGIPIGAIAFIFGVDRIVDMPRTAINVFGDFIYGLIVGKQEGMIDWEQYNRPTDLAQFTQMELDEAAAASSSAGQ